MRKILLALAVFCGLTTAVVTTIVEKPPVAEAFGACSGSLYGTTSYGGVATTTYGRVQLTRYADGTSLIQASTHGGYYLPPHIKYMKWGYADGAVTYRWGLDTTSWFTFTGNSHGNVMWALACIQPY